MKETVYPTKVDLWLVLVLVGSAGLGLFAVIAAGLQEGTWWPLVGFVVVFGVVGAIIFPTDYTLTDDLLLVRSGLIRYRVPVASIRRVAPSREAWSSPAWSLDRVRIDYDEGKRILISPREKDEFIRDIGERIRQYHGQ